MRNGASFSFICCLLLIMVLLFIPGSHSTARELPDISPNNDLNETKQDNGQSKSGARGSTPKHAGSATGNSTPSGTVQLSPPSAVTKIAYGSNPGNSTNGHSMAYASTTGNSTNGPATAYASTTGNSSTAYGSGGSVTVNATNYHSPPHK